MEQTQDQTQDQTHSAYTEKIISNIEMLSTIGKSYRKTIYKTNDLIKIYSDNMRIKNINMGEKYINDMIININNIFANVSRQSKYDLIEFVNSVILYSFKKISFKYTKKKIDPELPDYTMAEIKDLAK